MAVTRNCEQLHGEEQQALQHQEWHKQQRGSSGNSSSQSSNAYTIFDTCFNPLPFRIFNRTHQKNALVFVHRDHSVHEYVTEMQNFHLNAVAYYQQVLSGATGDIIKFLDDFRTGN